MVDTSSSVANPSARMRLAKLLIKARQRLEDGGVGGAA
jgi:hypothetical protein